MQRTRLSNASDTLPPAPQIIFNLAKPGFMRVFGGTWTIRPYDNASLDQLVNKHRPSALHRLQAGVRAVEAGLGMGGRTEESLVQLQQSIAPAFRPPPAVARVMQRIAAKQVRGPVEAVALAREGRGAAIAGFAAPSLAEPPPRWPCHPAHPPPADPEDHD